MPVINDNMSKPELRVHFKEMREGLTKDYRRSMDYEIESRIMCSTFYSEADIIFTYVSTDPEPDTLGIIHGAFANGKKVAVPKCTDKGIMEFYLIDSVNDLKKGKFGIMEPDESMCKKAVCTENSLCIVPGLSFDAQGYRLGRGGGYYDRFLKDFKGKSAGLCYHSFLRLTLPKDTFDIPVDILVTENFLREIKS
ncbi:MAG: 5-formyltetrahydrofolate cyclo-ligase [Clostridia bacterium]|nr:5-formyltetrahydrofolate cyclo-ligase [Clostridia bacterium]